MRCGSLRIALSVDSNGMCTLFKCPSTLNLSEGLEQKKLLMNTHCSETVIYRFSLKN